MAWFGRHKIWTGVLVLVVLIIVGALAGGGNDAPSSNDGAAITAPEQSEGRLYPGRADAQREDQERTVGGDPAKVDGVEATIASASFTQSLSEFEDAGYLVAQVTLRNVDSRTHGYNVLHWKVQLPGGAVKDYGFTGLTEVLGYGDLVAGGSVSDKVIFDVGDTKGDYYLIWKPDPYDAARGIWKVTV